MSEKKRNNKPTLTVFLFLHSIFSRFPPNALSKLVRRRRVHSSSNASSTVQRTVEPHTLPFENEVNNVVHVNLYGGKKKKQLAYDYRNEAYGEWLLNSGTCRLLGSGLEAPYSENSSSIETQQRLIFSYRNSLQISRSSNNTERILRLEWNENMTKYDYESIIFCCFFFLPSREQWTDKNKYQSYNSDTSFSTSLYTKWETKKKNTLRTFLYRNMCVCYRRYRQVEPKVQPWDDLIASWT